MFTFRIFLTHCSLDISYKCREKIFIPLIESIVVLQVEVAWEDPPGPARSDNCRTVYTPAPPPFPINDITIRSRDTEPITETDGRGDVTVTVRLVLI